MTRPLDPCPDSPDENDVRASLAAVVASPAFVGGTQLADFLTYIVERTLAGEPEQLKAYAIAVDVMGRDASFDPQSNAAVRVAAGRLRQALALYNSEPNTDPAVITLARGTYVPRFARADKTVVAPVMEAEEEEVAPVTPAPPSARTLKHGWLLGFMTAVVLSLLAAYNFMPQAGLFQRSALVQTRPELSKDDANRKPSIEMLLQLADTPYPPWFMADELADAMSSVAGRFGDYRTIAARVEESHADPSNTTTTSALDYVFKMSTHARGPEVRLYNSLIRGRDGEVLWSSTRTLIQPPLAQLRDTEAIVGETFAPLGSPNGLIYADVANGGPDRLGLRCVAATTSYFVRGTRLRHRRARDCAEELVEAGTRLPEVFAALTFLYLDEAREGFNRRGRNPFVAARAMAERAVELGPLSARAHQAMFASMKVSGQREQAQLAAREATRLNPYDTDIAADYAAWLISINELKEARAILTHIEPMLDVQPAWLVFARFVEAELSSEPRRASEILRGVDFNRSATLAMAVVIAAVREGDLDRARSAYDHMKLVAPNLAHSAQSDLMTRGFDQAVAARLADTFMRARSGLVGAVR